MGSIKRQRSKATRAAQVSEGQKTARAIGPTPAMVRLPNSLWIKDSVRDASSGLRSTTTRSNPGHAHTGVPAALPPHTCRNLVPTFPQRSPPLLLTTAACGGLRSTPDCRPRRAFLHLSYSYAPPCGPALLVTQCQEPTHAPQRKEVIRSPHRRAVGDAKARR